MVVRGDGDRALCALLAHDVAIEVVEEVQPRQQDENGPGSANHGRSLQWFLESGATTCAHIAPDERRFCHESTGRAALNFKSRTGKLYDFNHAVFRRVGHCCGHCNAPRRRVRKRERPHEAHRRRLLSRKMRESTGRNGSERTSSLETARLRRPRPLVWIESSTKWRMLAGAPLRSGGVKAAARGQGHVKATGETLLVPSSDRRKRRVRITGGPGKSCADERESDGYVVAMKRGNARGAKVPCCSAIPLPTREAGAR